MPDPERSKLDGYRAPVAPSSLVEPEAAASVVSVIQAYGCAGTSRPV